MGNINTQRMGYALRQPGMDTRTWCCAGRVVEEDGAVRWDENIGWIIDIDAKGELFGNELRARISGQDHYGAIPIEDGCEWVVAIPDGDASMNPVAIARPPNNMQSMPKSVGGISINGAINQTDISHTAEDGSFSPYDTEFRHAPYNIRQEYDGYYVLSTSACVFEGNDIRISSRQASQSFVRGEDFAEAVTKAVETLIPLCLDSLNAPIKLPLTWTIPEIGARQIFKDTLLAALSKVIKGE